MASRRATPHPRAPAECYAGRGCNRAPRTLRGGRGCRSSWCDLTSAHSRRPRTVWRARDGLDESSDGLLTCASSRARPWRSTRRPRAHRSCRDSSSLLLHMHLATNCSRDRSRHAPHSRPHTHRACGERCSGPRRRSQLIPCTSLPPAHACSTSALGATATKQHIAGWSRSDCTAGWSRLDCTLMRSS